jgi:hypothetical protein
MLFSLLRSFLASSRTESLDLTKRYRSHRPQDGFEARFALIPVTSFDNAARSTERSHSLDVTTRTMMSTERPVAKNNWKSSFGLNPA